VVSIKGRERSHDGSSLISRANRSEPLLGEERERDATTALFS
jgi:hypothetical protein